MWCYADVRMLEDALGHRTSDGEPKPALYDPEYEYLHVHRGSLPKGWGEALQALYLIQKKWKSPIINNFISKHYDVDIRNKIIQRNKQINRKLVILLYPKRIRDKLRITYKEMLLRELTVKRWLLMLWHEALKKAVEWYFKVPVDGTIFYKKQCMIDELVPNNWTDDFYNGTKKPKDIGGIQKR